jgi:hypothetical protein
MYVCMCEAVLFIEQNYFNANLFIVVSVNKLQLERILTHNVCKTVWLSEALLVYGEMTWTLLADSNKWY